jgi:ABC-type multidrug transport system ATPase subunit
MTNVIATNGLSKRYGEVLSVHDLDLAVPEGAIYGFLGPNGAGKTTSLKMILGLVWPTAGEAQVFGRTMNGRNRLDILRQVGSLIESPGYYGHLTGAENLRIVQTLRDVPAANVDEMLRLVRLDGQKDKLVRQYSLGMKQRLGLACAMLGHPRLLILDEPTNGLDPAGIQEMRELIISLPVRYEMTVLVSSHLLSEIDQIATSVGIINCGELVFQDTLAALHAQSEHHLALRTLDNAAAADILRHQGLAATIQGDDLLLPAMADENVARCSLALAAGGLGLVRIVEQRKSLEGVFLELTGTVVSL